MNLFPSVLLLLALFQSPPPATFDGTFKTIEGGHIVIELESGNTMRMVVNGSTKFVRDGKKAKPADFHEGEPVEVDAVRDIGISVVAVRVELVKSKPPVVPK